jgi:hypothetical protein
MDVQTAQPAAPGRTAAESADADRETRPDRLGAEVRESVVLLVMSLAVTAGISGGAQALLALVD